VFALGSQLRYDTAVYSQPKVIMDIFQIIYVVILSIVAVVMAVVGIQLFLVLRDVRAVIKRVDTAVVSVQTRFTQVVQPLQNLGGAVAGMKAGFKLVETFGQWLNRDKHEASK